MLKIKLVVDTGSHKAQNSYVSSKKNEAGGGGGGREGVFEAYRFQMN